MATVKVRRDLGVVCFCFFRSIKFFFQKSCHVTQRTSTCRWVMISTSSFVDQHTQLELLKFWCSLWKLLNPANGMCKQNNCIAEQHRYSESFKNNDSLQNYFSEQCQAQSVLSLSGHIKQRRCWICDSDVAWALLDTGGLPKSKLETTNLKQPSRHACYFKTFWTWSFSWNLILESWHCYSSCKLEPHICPFSWQNKGLVYHSWTKDTLGKVMCPF